SNGNISTQFDVRDTITIEVGYHVLEAGHNLMLQLFFFNELDHAVFISNDNLDSPWTNTPHPEGHFKAACRIPGDFMNESTISVSYRMMDSRTQIIHATDSEMLKFQITDKFNPE